MKEHSKVFCSQDVLAILEGRKTMFRVPVVPQPYCPRSTMDWDGDWWVVKPHYQNNYETVRRKCPFGTVGDLIWVQETYYDEVKSDEHLVAYRADNAYGDGGIKWKHAITMPRWASRITLETTAIRVEWLQDISGADALAEGVIGDECTKYLKPYIADQPLPEMCYANLWNSRYGRKFPWSSNPLVWVGSFKRVSP